MSDNAFEKNIKEKLGDRIAKIIIDTVREHPELTGASLSAEVEKQLKAQVRDLTPEELTKIFGILSWWVTLGG
ncbi:MAG: hypothetical protein ACFFB0_08740 [Promethearchaeota archaeon]